MKKILLGFIAIGLVISCSNSEVKKETEPIPEVKIIKSPELIDLEKTVSRLRGSSFIKSVSIDSNGFAEIYYWESYTAMKAAKPDTKTTLDQFLNYWFGSKAIEKALVDGVGRVFKSNEFVNKIKLRVTLADWHFTAEASRKDFEKFIGMKISKLSNREIWSKKYIDKYIPGVTSDLERWEAWKRWAKRFVKKENFKKSSMPSPVLGV